MHQYVYPDGTYSPKKPADGEHFYFRNPQNGNVERVFQWDDILWNWSDITNKSPGSPVAGKKLTPFAYYPGFLSPTPDLPVDPPKQEVKKSGCECGLHSVQPNSDRHSTWCRLYRKW